MTIKIDAATFNEGNNCGPGSEWYTARILSQEATNEILGENLSALIAIGKDGKPVAYLPYGTEISTAAHSESDVAPLLEFVVKIPVQDPPFCTKSYTLCYPKDGKPPRPCPC